MAQHAPRGEGERSGGKTKYVVVMVQYEDLTRPKKNKMLTQTLKVPPLTLST